MKDQKKNNKGFSLVELIVVVAIMAVLLGVLVPTLVRNVEKSKKQKDINNLSEVRNAIQLAMATEDFAGVNGTLKITGDDFTIATNGTVTPTPDPGTLTMTGTTKSESDFFKEVLANLNGGAEYTFNYASKLAQTDTAVVFILADEKVSGYVEVKSGKYYDSTTPANNKIQLQDQTAGAAGAGEAGTGKAK